jgi:NAD(P)-dependent dehydrogenase (short-subunit alcohol dehydrogenase family)
MSNLSGKTAFITDASRGMGRAAALEFAEAIPTSRGVTASVAPSRERDREVLL